MLIVFYGEFATGGNAARFSVEDCLAFLGFLGNLERRLLMSDPGIIDAIIQAVIAVLNSL